MSKGFSTIIIILGVLVLVGVAGGGYFLGKSSTSSPPIKIFPAPTGIACTLEAKICPDGTSVGRSGPNCEFAQCLATGSGETNNWKTYKNDQYRFWFLYPREPIFEINDAFKDKWIQVMLNQNKSDFVDIHAKIEKQFRGPANIYLDTTSIGQKQIGDYTWYTFYLPNGYGDGPISGQHTIFAYQLELNDIQYSVAFYGATSQTAEQLKLLSTFKFF